MTLLVLGEALVVSACSVQAAQTGTADPYAAEYEAAMADATSDFVRAVLADHVVTPAELAEAHAGFGDCLTDHGYAFLLDTDSTERVTVGVVGTAGPDENYMACQEKWVGEIDQFYLSQRDNPNNEDWDGLVAACLVAQGLAPDGFAAQDLKDLNALRSTEYSVGVDGEAVVISTPQDPNPTLPGGVYLDSLETAPCLMMPLTPEAWTDDQ